MAGSLHQDYKRERSAGLPAGSAGNAGNAENAGNAGNADSADEAGSMFG
jgi:hypothetical protein